MPHTNQLIEELREKMLLDFDQRPETQRAIALDFLRKAISKTEQECDKKWRALIESKRQMEHYDNMICSKCKIFIRERTSHHSEDGFSVCCGKKLERVQGETDNFSTYNSAIDDLLNNK